MGTPSIFDIVRFPSHEVQVGAYPLGGMQPIRLQSMTNTNTMDVKATVAQSIRIFEAGADYVRISTPNRESVQKLAAIRKELRAAGFNQPLVADIHFQAEVALEAARHVEKVRINPGNYIKGVSRTQTHFSQAETLIELEKARDNLKPLVEVCKQYGTAIRIGTNMGSLSPRIVAQYGNTPEGMVMATYEFLELFRELDFDQVVISLKASKPLIMVQAYEGMVEKMLRHNMSYPLHIGITEAGEGENGRIKSALGICTLLNKGIGDTLRVSLTEDPEKEIPFANKISSVYQLAYTGKEDNRPFSLKRFSLSEREIAIPFCKHKAIVVSEEPQSTTSYTASHSRAGISKRTEPDLYYSKSIGGITPEADKPYLLPAEIWNPDQAMYTYPIQLCEPENYRLDPTMQGKVFLQVCCDSSRQRFNPINSPKPAAIIADLGNCDFTGSLEDLVDFGQRSGVPVIVRKQFNTSETDDLISHAAILFGSALLERKIQGLWLEAPRLKDNAIDLAFGFLQSAGVRITRSEFISCPTCARTSFDLQGVLHQVQQHTSNFPGLKIAVMGCVVNGPGEMADADFGFVGTATGKLHLYKGKQPIIKNIEPGQAVEKLLEVLKENGFINP